jgi:HEAT repeat protein
MIVKVIMPWLLLRRLRSKNRYTFVRSAQRLAALRERRAVPTLINTLRHPGEWFREAAAQALGEIGDRRAISALQAIAQDEDPLVRTAVRDALRRLGAPLPAAEAKGTISRTSARPASAPANKPARAVARAPGRSDILKLLDSVALDGTAKSRQRVAEILASVGDESAVPVLASLLSDAECEVRRIVVRALARIGTSETIDALVRALHDRDLTTVTTASQALVALGAAAVEPLRRTLEGTDRRARQAALETLRRIDPDFTRPLRTKGLTPLPPSSATRQPQERAPASETPRVKTRPPRPATPPSAQSPTPLTLVLDGAAAQGVRQPAPELILALRDDDTAIRVAASRILRKLYPDWPRSRNARQAIPDFVAALHTDNFRVRAAAARALGRIGERSTLAVLRLLLNDARSQVRRAAEEAMEDIEEGAGPPQQSARR